MMKPKSKMRVAEGDGTSALSKTNRSGMGESQRIATVLYNNN